ncbi:MAG: malto-oligosyltrehalose synthase, partial [Cyanobacteria bacterium P01_F01_bin.3]
ELGTAEDYEALVSEAQQHGLGWLQDIVPNHMAFSNQNPYLMDALEHGPDSAYGDTFDIDWNSFRSELKGQVIAPMLGSDYRQCLERGELQLSYSKDGLKVSYYSLQLPICLSTYGDFFQQSLPDVESEVAERLKAILKRIDDSVLPEKGEARTQKTREIKQQLWSLFTSEESMKSSVEKTIYEFNGEADNADSFALLDSLLSKQFYQLTHWKVALEMLNYRRFFTVNELICLNAQHSHVFDQTHGLIQRLVKEGKITGLRVDHIDGLYDPLTYLNRLKSQAKGQTGSVYTSVYTIVEKILEADETLPYNWPIQGTSGYEFLTCMNRVFCQQENKGAFSKLYEEFAGVKDDYEQLFLDKKRLLAESELVGDIDNLAYLLNGVAKQMGSSSSAENLRLALKEIMIAFPVYRSYVSEVGRSEKDVHYIKEAIATVRSHSPEKSEDFATALEFVEKILLLEDVESLSEEARAQRLHFIMRMQQFTGPLTAKGIEDTLFYVYNRFTSLNEVGGAPGEFALSLEDFHKYNLHQQEHWPHNLNASSTHDTKRSEDVRSRLNVLSEMPDVWEQQINTWKSMNAEKKRVDTRPIPTPNDEYFLYQTLVGAYPFDEAELPKFKERIQAYVLKAGREAKENTNWTQINEAYEEGYASFIDTLLSSEHGNDFLDSLRSFQSKVKQYGIYNSLSQLLLKIASPGIPDFYQGSELWDLSLVDPDNRRPVDYGKRAHLLDAMKSQWESDPVGLAKDVVANWEDGRIKLFLILRGLAVRKSLSDVFETGHYVPLEVTGTHAGRVIAFARKGD